MSFSDPSTNTIYKRHVAPTIARAGLQPRRADDFHGQDVMEDIWIRMNEARLVLADVSGRNPNVLYETGIAHVLGKPLLLLSSGPGSKIPFDLNRFRHILYQRTTAGVQKLKRNLSAQLDSMLETFPTGSHLLNEIAAAATMWRKPFRDPALLVSLDTLDRASQHFNPESVTDETLSFCTATACQHGAAGQIMYWGGLCARRPSAAEDVLFGLFSPHRRPKIRIAFTISQFPTDVKRRVIRRMREHKVDAWIRQAVESSDFLGFLRVHYRAFRLTAPERDLLIEELQQIRL